jgi:hypothetical protein
MAVEIVEARDARVRADVFRFRYEIYVREMARPQKDADHAGKRIEDGLDAFAMILAAREAATGRICGTVRANLLADGDVGYYEELYGLDRLAGDARRRVSVTTRMMVERTKRGTLLAAMLASALYGYGLDRGVDADYIDCNPHLVPFFERLGYRAGGTIRHPEYGHVTLMRLDLGDLTHLRRVGSPFVGVHERRREVA